MRSENVRDRDAERADRVRYWRVELGAHVTILRGNRRGIVLGILLRGDLFIVQTTGKTLYLRIDEFVVVANAKPSGVILPSVR